MTNTQKTAVYVMIAAALLGLALGLLVGLLEVAL